MDPNSHRVQVRIKELKKYSRIFDKAAKGALFKAQLEAPAKDGLMGQGS